MTVRSFEPPPPPARLGVSLHLDAIEQTPSKAQAGPPAVSRTCIVETRQLYPGHVVPLTVLTAVYLAVQLAFAARLLDAIANPIGTRQLAQLAAWGWILSGVALTLVAWGSLILPHSHRSAWPVRRVAVALVVSALVCCETAYLVGPALTGLLADRMTVAERQCAVQLRVLAIARQDNAAEALPPGIRSALLRAPFGGLSCDGLPSVSRDRIGEALKDMLARQIGTAEQMYDNVFIPSVRSMRDAYNEYVAAQLRLVAEIRTIPDQQAQTWQRWLDRIGHAGLPPVRIPRRDWPRAAAEARDMGVAVPPEWNPADQATFTEAVATASRRNADEAYADFVIRHFQQALPTGLDWEGFVGQPSIQARWRDLIDTPAEASLAPGMGFPVFRRAVYEPDANRIVQPLLQDLLGAPGRFAGDGSLAPAGHAAAHWAIAPALLFAAAVLGSLWHAGVLLGLTGRIALPRIGAGKRWIVQVGVAVAVVILLVAWRTPSPVAAIPPGSSAGAATSCPSAGSICRTGRLVDVLWPIGAALRTVLLFGFDFGYDQAAAGDLTGTFLEPLLPRAQPRP